MSTVRAKFRLDLKQTDPNTKQASLVFNAAYDPDPSSPNYHFWQATPAGRLEMQIVNQAAADQFEQGKFYYLDFTPAEAL